MLGDGKPVPSAELVVAVFSGFDFLRGQRPDHVNDFPPRQLHNVGLGDAVLSKDIAGVFERQFPEKKNKIKINVSSS